MREASAEYAGRRKQMEGEIEALERELREMEGELRKEEVREKTIGQMEEQELKRRQECLTKEKQEYFHEIEGRKERALAGMAKVNAEIESTEEVLKDLKMHISTKQQLSGKKMQDGQIFILGQAAGKKKKKN